MEVIKAIIEAIQEGVVGDVGDVGDVFVLGEGCFAVGAGEFSRYNEMEPAIHTGYPVWRAQEIPPYPSGVVSSFLHTRCAGRKSDGAPLSGKDLNHVDEVLTRVGQLIVRASTHYFMEHPMIGRVVGLEVGGSISSISARIEEKEGEENIPPLLLVSLPPVSEEEE